MLPFLLLDEQIYYFYTNEPLVTRTGLEPINLRVKGVCVKPISPTSHNYIGYTYIARRTHKLANSINAIIIKQKASFTTLLLTRIKTYQKILYD